jgi:hypothetical protein
MSGGITAESLLAALAESRIDVCACGLDDDGKTAGLDGLFDLAKAASILNEETVDHAAYLADLEANYFYEAKEGND